jgi:hypothetical protein
MNEYLSHFSAAEIWEVPCFEAILAPTIEKTNLVDITVSEHNKRFRKNGKLVHSCAIDLPAGTVTTRHERFVASPPAKILHITSRLGLGSVFIYEQ